VIRDFEAALKAAGDPTRARILKLLEGGPLCVCQVQAVLGLAPSTVSKHLAILRAAGLVDDRRSGKWIEYAHAGEPRNPFAPSVLALLGGPLDADPRVAADRERLGTVTAIPLAELCAAPPFRRPGLPPGRRPRRPRAAAGGAGRAR
jgi:arsenate reductase/ArsR family transcriptional regulator